MPNPNYQKGRRKEYSICDKLRKEGFEIVQRTAGSHSPIDVIAIHREKKLIKLIQAKPDNYPEKKTQELLKEHGWLSNNFKVEFEVI